MKTIRTCLVLLVVVTSGNSFAAPQAPAPKGTAKQESATRSREQKVTREIYGKIQTIKGTLITLQTRTGNLVQVDAKGAMEAQRSAPLVVGRAIAVKGTIDKAGVFHAEILQRAKDSSTLWPADR